VLDSGEIICAHRILDHLYTGAGTLLSFYCMGLNQSAVGMWKNHCLINLHLLTGQIVKPGAGPFSPPSLPTM
jgi:ferredoxin-nitrate reductase